MIDDAAASRGLLAELVHRGLALAGFDTTEFSAISLLSLFAERLGIDASMRPA